MSTASVIGALLLGVAILSARPAGSGVGAAPREARGALSVLPANPYCFRGADGKPVVLVGDYTWGTFSDVDFDYVRLLDDLKARGLNLARVWLWWGTEEITTDPIPARHVEPFLRTGPGDAADGRPRYDLTKLNPAFFARLKALCRAAQQRGTVLQLIAMDAWMIKHAELWKVHACARGNNVNGVDGDPAGTGTGTDGRRGFCSMGNPGVMEVQKRLLRAIVDATNEFGGLTYEIANENYYSEAWELALCDYVTDVERTKPRQHLLLRRDVPSHSYVVQRWEPEIVHRVMLERRSLRQPLIFDTDWIINNDDDEVRRAMWTALATNGHFDYMDDALDYRVGKPYHDPRPALHRQIGYAAAFMKRLKPWEMAPDDALVKAGKAFAMASRDTLVAYLPEGGRVTLDLAAVPGPRRARWYDPRTGRFGRPAAVRGGAAATLDAPGPGDWALVVQ